jgi:MFS family permease
MKKPSLLAIFLTVFVDLVGFGIVLPLLPTYAHSFGASGLVVGALMASYSAMQFLFAPLWGAWSDRVGRRPVLLISIGGNVASYALFAVASTMQGSLALGLILASRVFAGICGANITVAQAYIADITPPRDRSKRMGLIGMAFGLGFIIGPALAILGQKLFGKIGPGALASAICAVNFGLALFRLPESRQPGSAPAAARGRLAHLGHVFRHPTLGLLVVVFFLATFGFTCFETTLGLLIARNFQLSDAASHNTNAFLFSFAGIIGAFVQAGPIGRLVKKLGEPRLIAASLVIFGIGLAPMPWIRGHTALDWRALMAPGAGSWWLVLAFVALIAIGSGLTRPPLFGLVSMLSAENERGMTLGVTQSAGSLARIFGPLFAGAFFDQHPAWPYVTCAGIALVTGVVAWNRLVGRVTLPSVAPNAA